MRLFPQRIQDKLERWLNDGYEGLFFGVIRNEDGHDDREIQLLRDEMLRDNYVEADQSFDDLRAMYLKSGYKR